MKEFEELEFESERLILKGVHHTLHGEELNPVILDTIDTLEPWLYWAKRGITVEETSLYLRRVSEKPEDYGFRLYLKSQTDCHNNNTVDHPLIGICGIIKQQDGYELSYWLHKGYTGKGYISEAVKFIMDFAVDTLKVKRFTIITQVFNKPSVKLAKKLGFESTGFEFWDVSSRWPQFADEIQVAVFLKEFT